MKLKKALFYILSFTWGLPCTAAGLIVAAALRISDRRPQRWGWCLSFETGASPWGGASLGIIMLTCPGADAGLKAHEHGHALQNCVFGPLMPFLVSIPSLVRYWSRTVAENRGLTPKTEYDGVWFESQATRLGADLMRRITR